MPDPRCPHREEHNWMDTQLESMLSSGIRVVMLNLTLCDICIDRKYFNVNRNQGLVVSDKAPQLWLWAYKTNITSWLNIIRFYSLIKCRMIQNVRRQFYVWTPNGNSSALMRTWFDFQWNKLKLIYNIKPNQAFPSNKNNFRRERFEWLDQMDQNYVDS